jgi:hypothetical protein
LKKEEKTPEGAMEGAIDKLNIHKMGLQVNGLRTNGEVKKGKKRIHLVNG